MNHYKRYSGFTLIELLIVMVVLAILVSLAVPSMEQTVKSNSVRALQRSYLSAFSYARSEAVTRNKLVSLCAVNARFDGCSGNIADWSRGWVIFIDNVGAAPGNGELDTGEEVLRIFENRGNSTIRVTDRNAADYDPTAITWNYRGFVHEERSFLLVVCDRDNTARFARGLVIEQSGRVLQSRENSQGIHENPYSNQALSCDND